MGEVKQRAAGLTDLKDVWDLVRGNAADIPFDVESEAAQESVLSEVMRCCTSGLSPLALEGKAVVGALLARRDDFEWGLRNANVIHVAYAAVAPEHKGVLKSLFSKVQDEKAQVLVSVKAGEKLGLADELKSLGFAHECTAESGWGDLYKWQPPANGHANAA